MKIVNLSEQNSIINQYMAEMRDVDYQKNRFLFRNNIQRIGEFDAFVSAYREYTDAEHHNVGIHVEYLATPDIDGKTLIIADPMLATGGSMEMGYKAILTKGTPKCVHVACVIACPEGIEHIRKTFPDAETTVWCAAIDEKLNEHKYIVPGFGDAGDLCYGGKL